MSTLDTRIEDLARDLLAVPENAGLYTDPAALLVRMSAHIVELRQRLDGVCHDRETAEKWLGVTRDECRNLRANCERLQDAAARLIPPDMDALLALVDSQV
ncbi:hypothetical protein AB0L82_43145 [Nocardia sp. NPDC052001]|uniref:hypothetical protein n=1 Tax=Nocardia sp. NPDC052001 TaxID=3154853 RepID=UPI003442060B